MRKSVLFLFMWLTASGWAGSHAALPKALMEAQTAYVDDVSWHSTVGDQCSNELKKWGRFKLVSDQKEADLVFHLSGTIEDLTTLDVVDGRTGEKLWSTKPNKTVKLIAELRRRVEEQQRRAPK